MERIIDKDLACYNCGHEVFTTETKEYYQCTYCRTVESDKIRFYRKLNEEESYDLFMELVPKVGEVITPNKDKVKESIKNIQNEVEKYILDAKLESLIIGISGGLDSAVTVALVKPICEKNNIKLLGLSIPLSSSNKHREQAKWVGETYCDEFKEMTEWETTKTNNKVNEVLSSLNTEDKDEAIAQGNIKARLRMMSLYYLAGINNGAVLSTDNYSEYWLGFWTLHGDIGDISPIQYIEKGWELPEFAKELGVRQDIIDQKASDGLSVTEEDSDEAQLGLSYKEIATIILGYENRLPLDLKIIYNRIKENSKVKNIIERHNKTQYKRNGTFEITREMTKLNI